jgi:acetylornithine deacetylase/succinyl-diaminopimelate desuccinylase-like protein
MKPSVRPFIEREWQASVLPTLAAYVRIPNQSPAFDPHWQTHGHMQRAVELLARWARTQAIPGMTVQVRELPGRTPLLLIDVPGERADCVLLYGHLDKQPEFTGWLPGLGPWEPVIRDGKLYGRGAADDGYALFSCLTAIAALKAGGARLARCMVLIEACEESGSVDLPAHLDALGAQLGEPSLVICLDAECGNYEQLWSTTSLRGNLTGTLRVQVLTEGVHSGMGTGIAATPFRIASQLLARLEDPLSGEVLLDSLRVEVPPQRRAQLANAARVLGAQIAGKMPFAGATQPISDDPLELLLANTWRATLAVTGAEGLPPLQSAGNVLLPQVAFKLSLRLPPSCDAQRIGAQVKQLLERDPPYGASVQFEADAPSQGWNAPATAAWLDDSLQRASRELFSRDALYFGSGGTIPFMSMLGQRFPRTQFFITGVLGPHSNAHGPNEFLHLDYAQRLTVCVAQVLEDHAARPE